MEELRKHAKWLKKIIRVLETRMIPIRNERHRAVIMGRVSGLRMSLNAINNTIAANRPIIGWLGDIPIHKGNFKPLEVRTPAESKCLHECVKLMKR